eukprot:2800183-Rhodomonas_salina.2
MLCPGWVSLQPDRNVFPSTIAPLACISSASKPQFIGAGVVVTVGMVVVGGADVEGGWVVFAAIAMVSNNM